MASIGTYASHTFAPMTPTVSDGARATPATATAAKSASAGSATPSGGNIGSSERSMAHPNAR